MSKEYIAPSINILLDITVNGEYTSTEALGKNNKFSADEEQDNGDNDNPWD